MINGMHLSPLPLPMQRLCRIRGVRSIFRLGMGGGGGFFSVAPSSLFPNQTRISILVKKMALITIFLFISGLRLEILKSVGFNLVKPTVGSGKLCAQTLLSFCAQKPVYLRATETLEHQEQVS